ncbi:MAG: hypothetical protein Kow00108_15880 [Calditrichia bacterium]
MKIINILIVISFFFLHSCTNLEQENVSSQEVEFPDQESYNTSMVLTRDGKMVADVWANHVLTFNNKKITVLKDSISVDFFDRDGKHKSLLTANEGKIFTNTNNMEASGNVIVTSDSGWVLFTERLMWDNVTQKVKSDTNVIFITDLDTLYGDYFESDPDLKQYIIKNTSGVSRRNIRVK